MTRSHFVWSAIATALLSTVSAVLVPAVAAPSIAPPPIEAFARLPEVDSMALSPNGRLLAWIDNSTSPAKVIMMDTDSGKTLRTLAFEQAMKLRGIEWASDATVLIRVSVTAAISMDSKNYEWFRYIAADVSGGPTRVLLMNDPSRIFVTGADLLAAHPDKEGTVIMSTLDYSATQGSMGTGTHIGGERRRSGWVTRLYAVNTGTGDGKPIDDGTQFTNGYAVDAQGSAAARLEFNPQWNSYRLFGKRDGRWKDLEPKIAGEMTLVGMSEDGSAAIVLAANGGALIKAWAVALDGSSTQVFAEDATYDIQGVVLDDYTNAVKGVNVGGREPYTRWLDEKEEKRSQALGRAFPSMHYEVISRSRDSRRLLVRTWNPSHADTFYLVDFAKGSADIAGEAYPALTDWQAGEVRFITYKARDGVEIPAYLTLPPGSSGKAMPMVVLPHGGPESRDYPEFYWLSQFLASRGYLVLQPEFRGSTGFGEAFRQAGYHQWGGLMQNDVTDGVAAVVAMNLADPQKVCIVGISYGGYAALAGAAFTPGLYRCAASIGGISDLPMLLVYETHQHGKESDVMSAFVNHIGTEDSAGIAAKSPARSAPFIHAPILLIHGVNDTVVPIEQSETMARALTNAGKSVEFVKLEGEDHWLSGAESRQRVLTELEKFLSANIPANH